MHILYHNFEYLMLIELTTLISSELSCDTAIWLLLILPTCNRKWYLAEVLFWAVFDMRLCTRFSKRFATEEISDDLVGENGV